MPDSAPSSSPVQAIVGDDGNSIYLPDSSAPVYKNDDDDDDSVAAAGTKDSSLSDPAPKRPASELQVALNSSGSGSMSLQPSIAFMERIWGGMADRLAAHFENHANELRTVSMHVSSEIARHKAKWAAAHDARVTRYIHNYIPKYWTAQGASDVALPTMENLDATGAVPSLWDYNRGPVPVDSNSEEFLEVSARYAATRGESVLNLYGLPKERIVAIYRVQNCELWSAWTGKYLATQKKEQLAKSSGQLVVETDVGKVVNPQNLLEEYIVPELRNVWKPESVYQDLRSTYHLWHGTDVASAFAIAETGVTLRVAKSTGVLGAGFYTPPCSAVSSRYAHGGWWGTHSIKSPFHRSSDFDLIPGENRAVLDCIVTTGLSFWPASNKYEGTSPPVILTVDDGLVAPSSSDLFAQEKHKLHIEADSVVGKIMINATMVASYNAANVYPAHILVTRMDHYSRYAVLFRALFDTVETEFLNSFTRTSLAVMHRLYFADFPSPFDWDQAGSYMANNSLTGTVYDLYGDTSVYIKREQAILEDPKLCKGFAVSCDLLASVVTGSSMVTQAYHFIANGTYAKLTLQGSSLFKPDTTEATFAMFWAVALHVKLYSIEKMDPACCSDTAAAAHFILTNANRHEVLINTLPRLGVDGVHLLNFNAWMDEVTHSFMIGEHKITGKENAKKIRAAAVAPPLNAASVVAAAATAAAAAPVAPAVAPVLRVTPSPPPVSARAPIPAPAKQPWNSALQATRAPTAASGLLPMRTYTPPAPRTPVCHVNKRVYDCQKVPARVETSFGVTVGALELASIVAHALGTTVVSADRLPPTGLTQATMDVGIKVWHIKAPQRLLATNLTATQQVRQITQYHDVHRATLAKLKKANGKCTICQMDFATSVTEAKEVKKLACDHYFHRDCLTAQFEASGRRGISCSNCRAHYGPHLSSSIETQEQHHGSLVAWKSDTIQLEGEPEVGCYGFDAFFFLEPNSLNFDKLAHHRFYLPLSYESAPGTRVSTHKVAIDLVSAFNRGFVFRYGQSQTRPGVVGFCFGSVPVKTAVSGGVQKHGYPDPGYVNRLIEALTQCEQKDAYFTGYVVKTVN